RARLEITLEQAKVSPTCPDDIIKRLTKKFERVKEEGKIAFFDIYHERLEAAWTKLRTSSDLANGTSISLTIGAGSPDLPGLTIQKGASDKSAILVSFNQGPQPTNWMREWIRATIIHNAAELLVTEPLSMAQAQGAIVRILAGESLQNYPIPLLKVLRLNEISSKAFAIVANKLRGEIAILINEIQPFRDSRTIASLHAAVVQTIEKLKLATPGQYRYLRQDLIDCVENSLRGPESIGIGLPMIILAVAGVPGAHSKSLPTEQQGISSHQSENSPSGSSAAANQIVRCIEFSISDDRLRAVITTVKVDAIASQKIAFDRNWFESQLRLNGVVFGLLDDIWEKIEAAWLAKAPLEGAIAAEGVPAIPGGEPYLYLVYKDAPELPELGGDLDIREAQQRTLVQEGQLIAEIRYKKMPSAGRTITGQVLQAPLEELKIQIGEGIAQYEAGKFYASTDGIPIFDQDTLSVSKVFVHNGDVDLKSGNIRFDGPVEIKGSIDTGATVRVKGPLLIHGMIRGGHVYCQESIEVKQGIVTTERGLVKCKGNLKAEFIENSRIQCGGTLKVNKAILNSQVYVAHSIVVVSDGGIAGGGLISCREALVSNNIGFPSGARTKLILGVDVRALFKVKLREGRLVKLKDASDRLRLELRELSGKKEAQLTPKHRERKEKVLKLVLKAKALQEKAELAIIVAQNSVSYNPAAVMVAYKRLSFNCDVEISGQHVLLQTEMLSAAVCAKKRRDSHLCTAEEVKLEISRIIEDAVVPTSVEQKAS
ncbi:MAG: FapA family protein, partial [Proteobacteria bacterium]|nr:FapA family protein [Pseudomonadota bacterium]